MTVKEALAMLFSAFPSERYAQSATIALYEKKLSDIPPDVLGATVNRLIDTAKFFPSIADFRHVAADLAGLLPAPAEEALAIVRRADVRKPVYRRDGSLAYIERYWNFSEDVSEPTMRAINAALEKVGDSVREDSKDIFGWELGFKATYSAVAGEQASVMLEDLSRARLIGRSDRKLLEG